MAEEEIRKHLARRAGETTRSTPVRATGMGSKRSAVKQQSSMPDSFKNFSASHMLCPTCRRAMPVRERLMLFLPDGVLYDYLCITCGTSTGTRKISST